MDDLEFRCDRQLGTEKFVLKSDTLVIMGEARLEKSRVIKLSSISPRCEIIKRRFHSLYLAPSVLAALCWVASWSLATHNYDIIAGLLALVGFGFLFFLRFEPIEGALFRSKTGEVLFVVYHPLKAAYTYDAFVSELQRRVDNIARN